MSLFKLELEIQIVGEVTAVPIEFSIFIFFYIDCTIPTSIFLFRLKLEIYFIKQCLKKYYYFKYEFHFYHFGMVGITFGKLSKY